MENELFDYQNTKAWYCVKTQNRREEEVKEALDQRRITMGIEDQLLRTVIPYITEQTVRGDKVVETKKKLYPGYVFVEMFMTDNAWYIVRNTRNVHGFIGSHGHGSKPTPVSESDILKVLRKTGEAESEINFKEGQQVRIINGPFEGSISTIKFISGNIAKVTVNMFDRETDVEIDINDLEEYNG